MIKIGVYKKKNYQLEQVRKFSLKIQVLHTDFKFEYVDYKSIALIEKIECLIKKLFIKNKKKQHKIKKIDNYNN